MTKESHPVIAGKYEVLEELGDGAAGTAYKVRHALLDTLLCVTVLPAALTDDPRQLALVEDAVRRALGLRHEHIVPVLDFGEDGERYHLVEAFVDAEPLDHVLGDGKPLAPADALHVARQLADALAYAHERGVVHGALTPATVRMHPGAPPRAMLSGFATASAAARVPYSAPERLAGTRDDARSDVFALGLLLFEMLEGKRFFTGSDEEIREILLHGDGPLLPQFSCIAPSGVSGLVGRALRRSPAHRQQSMAQVRSEIDACLRRLGERSAEAKPPRSAAIPVRRHPVLVVDEALEQPAEDQGALPPAAAPSETRPLGARRRRVAVKVEPAPPAPAVPGRVLTRASGVPAASRRRLSIAGVIVIAAVGVAASWPILRSITVVPAAPEGASDAASRPIEQPAPATDAAALPRLVPVAPVADEEAPAPPAPAAVLDRVAPAEETSQPNAPAGETAASTKPEPVPHVAPPRIVSHSPRRRDALRVTEGTALDFDVRASAEDPDAALAYVWFVDGRRVGRQRRFRFVTPPAATATTHAVEVEVSGDAGLKAPRLSWTVDVAPRMREIDVRGWLERLASAWERRDLATLQLYRIVTNEEEADAIRKRLPRAKDHQVSIGVERIRTRAQYATVAFALAEFDARGRLVSSQHESYELEKRASGFVGLRAR